MPTFYNFVSFILGALRDSTTTYSVGYYFAGTSLGITCLLFIANYCILELRKGKNTR